MAHSAYRLGQTSCHQLRLAAAHQLIGLEICFLVGITDSDKNAGISRHFLDYANISFLTWSAVAGPCSTLTIAKAKSILVAGPWLVINLFGKSMTTRS